MKKTQLDIIGDLFQIPIYVYKNKECIYTVSPSEKYLFIQNSDVDFCSVLVDKTDEYHFPVIYFENANIFYGMFRHESIYYWIGPMQRNEISRKELNQFKSLHNIKGDYDVKQLGMGILTKLLVLLYEGVSGIRVLYEDILIDNKFLDENIYEWNSNENYEIYQLSQSEFERQHTGGIAFEKRLLDMVKNGEVDNLKKTIGGFTPDASDFCEVAVNSTKQIEYLLITTLTLVSRAAIEGGMNAEEAYVLGDVYMRKIEQNFNNPSVLQKIGIQAQIEFTEKVYETKKRRSENIFIEKCKDYIAKNLRKEIKIGEIASQIGTSRSYLSHRFSEFEGITIQQYILRERLEHSANLLKYSDYPISLIAEYFKFSSQSHFGSCFKKLYGVTPKEYRVQNSR